MKTSFACVAEDKWCLAVGLEIYRREALLGEITFEVIIGRIASEAQLVRIKQNSLDKCSGYHRVEVVLEVERSTIDLFHNSRCGYRAQYYHSMRSGELANEYAVRMIAPRAKFLAVTANITLPWTWVEKSLSDRQAKVWIHQGRWFREKRKSDRNICVQRWAANLESPDPTVRKKALWGSLSAFGETKIDIKGGYVDSNGIPLGKSLKPDRSREIFELGYT